MRAKVHASRRPHTGNNFKISYTDISEFVFAREGNTDLINGFMPTGWRARDMDITSIPPAEMEEIYKTLRAKRPDWNLDFLRRGFMTDDYLIAISQTPRFKGKPLSLAVFSGISYKTLLYILSPGVYDRYVEVI